MKVTVSAPTRVDLAGGTLDLYPLYLFMGGGITINAGITIKSQVIITTREDFKININSVDLGKSTSFDSIASLDLHGETSFIQRAIASYAPECGLDVETYSQAPKGSGLGASSSLLMALSAALLKIKGEEIIIPEMIDRGAAIEAGHLGIPTGKQDYYGAVLGKIHALYFNEKGCTYEELAKDKSFAREINESLIVSFTGISHYSGANNWDILKMAIDRTGATYDNLVKIKKVTNDLYNAFKNNDIEKIADCVGREWELRKHLSDGITNDFIDNAIKKAADAGAWSSKLCGAGGGGCMITFAPMEKRSNVINSLENAGIKVMETSISYEGLTVKTLQQEISYV